MKNLKCTPSHVLVSYCYFQKLPQNEWFTQYKCSIVSSGDWKFINVPHQAKLKVWVGLCSFLRSRG